MQNWCRRFYHTGGFAYAYTLISSVSESTEMGASAAAYKSCLVLLLKIIHYFMQGTLKQLEMAASLNKVTATLSDVGLLLMWKDLEAQARNTVLALSQGTTETIDEQIDFAEFLAVLLRLVERTVSIKGEDESTPFGRTRDIHASLAEHALYLVAAALAARPLLLDAVFAYESFETLLMTSVVHCTDALVRQVCVRGWRHVCVEDIAWHEDAVPPLQRIVRTLLAQYPLTLDGKAEYDEYFDLLCSLFARCNEEVLSLSLSLPYVNSIS